MYTHDTAHTRVCSARMTNEVIFYKRTATIVPTTHREAQAEPGARSRPHAHTRGRVRTMESDASEYTFI